VPGLPPRKHPLRRAVGSSHFYSAFEGAGILATGLAPPPWNFGAAAAALGFIATRASLEFRKVSKTESPDALYGCLHTLHAVLLGDDKQSDCELRICLHQPDEREDPKHLVQLTEYVGSDVAGKINRKFLIGCGIAGQAYRMPGSILAYHLDESEPFDDQMIRVFSYTKHQAAELSDDRKSYAAMTIGSRRQPVAVLYLDAKKPGFFGNKASIRQKAIARSCLGIAEFIERRYK
jgi:hypothetical protein